MNRKLTAIVSTLALLTLACLILVSNLIGGKKPVVSSTPLQATPQPTATAKAQHSQTPAPQSAYKLSPAENQIYAELVKAQEQLGKISAAVAANDWAGAQSLFAAFSFKAHRLPGPQLHHPDISPVLQDFFDLYSVNLDQALSAQNARQAQFAVNQLFGIIGEQRARFGGRGVPLEVHRLRFLAREVELWSEAGDERMVRVRLNALNEAWREASPLIRARRNGAALTKQIEPLLAQLSSPRQDSQSLSALTTELNKSLDQADKLFQRQLRPSGTVSPAGRGADEE